MTTSTLEQDVFVDSSPTSTFGTDAAAASGALVTPTQFNAGTRALVEEKLRPYVE